MTRAQAPRAQARARGLVIALGIAAAAIAAIGCPAARSKARDGGRGRDAHPGDPRDAGGLGDAGSGSGVAASKVEIRVEWKGASAAVRASPGRNPCLVARRGRARVHTLWGVANAVVILEAPVAGTPAAPAPVMLTVTDCEVTPPVAVAAGTPVSIRIYDADQRRHVVRIAHALTLDELAAAPVQVGGKDKDGMRAVLAWAGAEVEVPAAAAGAIGVATDESPEDIAWVVVAPASSRIAITDDTGAVGFDAVAPGTYPVSAWLPPSAGEKARLVEGTVTIEAGRTAKVTIDVEAATVVLTPPPPYSAGSGIAPGSGSGADDGKGSAAGDGADDDAP